MSLPRTLGELRQSPFSEQRLSTRRVKDEMRDNLIVKLRQGGTIFPGIVGYDDTVVPQIVNAILSRHNFILLGLRGQAKSRILRALTSLLDAQMPYVAGCEIHDNPYAPICRRCQEEIAKLGDDTPIAYLTPEQRYVEKLATPDVTIADLIGDIDPIKAARGGHELGSEYTVHYGLLPRANHGIFAINELPDLAGKIQVGLFNIMQEGDVQIKGYPIRLPLDVALVFSANPEDYTARGKIITPLKDRIGSEIRTHYPATVEEGIAITAQESWTQRNGHKLHLPKYVQEVIERIAFAAREDKKIDKRSGVSQRLPISAMENVISNAERRAIHQEETAGGAAHRRCLRRHARDHRQAGTGIRRRDEGRRPRQPRTDSRRPSRRLTTRISKASTCSRSCNGSTWAEKFNWPTPPAPPKRCRPCAAFRD